MTAVSLKYADKSETLCHFWSTTEQYQMYYMLYIPVTSLLWHKPLPPVNSTVWKPAGLKDTMWLFQGLVSDEATGWRQQFQGGRSSSWFREKNTVFSEKLKERWKCIVLLDFFQSTLEKKKTQRSTCSKREKILFTLVCSVYNGKEWQGTTNIYKWNLTTRL